MGNAESGCKCTNLPGFDPRSGPQAMIDSEGNECPPFAMRPVNRCMKKRQRVASAADSDCDRLGRVTEVEALKARVLRLSRGLVSRQRVIRSASGAAIAEPGL